MFTPDAVIDAVQATKKTWVNTFVSNPVVKQAMLSFVEAQAAYTKQAVKAGTDTASIVVGETVKSMHEAARFDYVKFGEGVVKAYQNLNRASA